MIIKSRCVWWAAVKQFMERIGADTLHFSYQRAM